MQRWEKRLFKLSSFFCFSNTTLRWPTRAKHNSILSWIHNDFSWYKTILLGAQQYVVMQNNFTRCTTIFHGAQQFFVIPNNSTRCTTIFLDARQFFTVHNNFSRFKSISQCTTRFRDAKQIFTMHNKLSWCRGYLRRTEQRFAMQN